MRTTLLIVVVGLTLLGGCIVSKSPSDSQPFSNVRSGRELEGTYNNIGEVGFGSRPVLLSAVIWPASDVPHKDITEVKLVAVTDSIIQVKGVSGGQVLKESTFVEGKDFQIANGRITIRRSAGVAGFKSGDPIFGPYYESVELGLDESGQGKFQSRFGVAGLVFLILPMAIGGSEDVRFVRLSTP